MAGKLKALRIKRAAWTQKLVMNNTASRSTAGSWLAGPIRWGYQRPIRVGIVERVAEYWICQRCRWNQDILRGKLVTPNGGSGAYRIFKPLALLQLNPKFESLRIAKWSRFGNSVIQLRNLLYIAELFKVRTLEFAEPHAFFAGTRIGAFELKWEVARHSAVGLSLEGLYFFLDAFQVSVDEDASARIFTKYLRPLLVPELRQPDPRVRREDLVLHFRAGDVFRKSPHPHPHYGQPPLSYYLAAVEREQPQRVWLVFEDRANCCIDAAESALRARGFEVVVQSGATIEDIRVLMTAERLVSSRGTFVRAIANLSERLRKVYFFEGQKSKLSLPHVGVEVVVVRDIGREFTAEVLSHNWTGSSDQRGLLLSYPPEKLSFSQ